MGPYEQGLCIKLTSAFSDLATKYFRVSRTKMFGVVFVSTKQCTEVIYSGKNVQQIFGVDKQHHAPS